MRTGLCPILSALNLPRSSFATVGEPAGEFAESETFHDGLDRGCAAAWRASLIRETGSRSQEAVKLNGCHHH